MFVAIGYILCLGCIFGSYIVHGGNMQVIIHAMPIEMMAIGGGAIGAFLVNNQMKVVKASIAGLGQCGAADGRREKHDAVPGRCGGARTRPGGAWPARRRPGCRNPG